MSRRFHINPEKGPMPCSASTPEGCRYGPETTHYEDRDDAMSAWTETLAEQYSTTGSGRRSENLNRSREIAVNKDLDSIMSKMNAGYTDYVNFANKNIRNHNILAERLSTRCERTNSRIDALRNGAMASSPHLKDQMTRMIDEERDTNAEMMLALTNSRLHENNSRTLPFEGIPFNVLQPATTRVVSELDVVREVNNGEVPRSRRRNPAWRQRGVDSLVGVGSKLHVYESRVVSAEDESLSVTIDGSAEFDGGNRVPVLVRMDDTKDPGTRGLSDHARAEALYTMKVAGTDSAVVVMGTGEDRFESHRVHFGELVNGQSIDEILESRKLSNAFSA